MHETIEDRVSECGLAQVRMPVGDRELAGDNGGAPIETVIQDFQDIALGGLIQYGQSPVIKDEHVEVGQLLQLFDVAAVPPRAVQVLEQARQAQVTGGRAVAAGFVGERCG